MSTRSRARSTLAWLTDANRPRVFLAVRFAPSRPDTAVMVGAALSLQSGRRPLRVEYEYSYSLPNHANTFSRRIGTGQSALPPKQSKAQAVCAMVDEFQSLLGTIIAPRACAASPCHCRKQTRETLLTTSTMRQSFERR